jgi:hypothetical protein
VGLSPWDEVREIHLGLEIVRLLQGLHGIAGGIGETPHHVAEGVDLAHGAQHLLVEALALSRRGAHGHVAEGDLGVAGLLGVVELREGVHASVGHLDRAKIGLAPGGAVAGFGGKTRGNLCAQTHGFNLHAATKVAANDKQGRVTLCKYILRPPVANDRLKILDDGEVRLEFKKPWSDGTHAASRSRLFLYNQGLHQCPPSRTSPPAGSEVHPVGRTAPQNVGVDIVCSKCQSQLRLIALIKTEDVAKRILTAMHLPADVPDLHPARPPPGEAGAGDDGLN